jgi:tetratricopeptide (TPR) repeat protein
LSAALLAELTASAADAERADALYRRLSPFDGLNVDTAEVSTGAVSRYLGLLAAARGQMEEAERHFEDALEMNERMGARPWLAHTQRDYGRMLAERGETKRASELVASAIATYRELGMESYATTSGHGHVHTPGRVIRDDA